MILFLDTETSGLNPGQICQLSYVMQDKEKFTSKNFFFKVNYVEYGAYLVHGFSKEKLEILSNGKDFSCFVEEIEQDFLKADLLCAHNTAFDFKFLRKEFERTGREFMSKAEFCTMKNSLSFCGLPKKTGRGFKYPKLNELCHVLGISNEEITYFEEKLFQNATTYHDARFDTTALVLAFNRGVGNISAFTSIKDLI